MKYKIILISIILSQFTFAQNLKSVSKNVEHTTAEKKIISDAAKEFKRSRKLPPPPTSLQNKMQDQIAPEINNSEKINEVK